MDNIQIPVSENVITDNELVNMLKNHNADYDVDVIPTPNPFNENEPTGFFTSYRTDTKRIFNQGLSKRWQPIQNRDSMQVLADLSKITNVQLRHFYLFDGGREICAQIDLGGEDIGGGDKVSNYLSMINSHDGSHSMSIFETPFRWFCKNQITPSIKNAKRKNCIVSIHHTITAKEKLEILCKTVEMSQHNFNKNIELYKNMLNTKVNASLASDIIEGFFPIKKESGKRGTTIRKNKIEDIHNRYNSADSGRTPRETAWNLYNAVQGHIQHYKNNTDAHQRSVLIGPDAIKAANAMSFILSITATQDLANALTLTQQEKESIAL